MLKLKLRHAVDLCSLLRWPLDLVLPVHVRLILPPL